MSNLTRFLTANEEIQVEETLRELYGLQGIKHDKDSFATILREIIRCGKPFPAILAGLYSLKEQELKRISFPAIMGAISSKCIAEEEVSVPCDNCHDGRYVYRDAEGRNWVKACYCLNGEKWQRRGLKRMDPYENQTASEDIPY